MQLAVVGVAAQVHELLGHKESALVAAYLDAGDTFPEDLWPREDLEHRADHGHGAVLPR
jgi:hypothetical protein